jgi:ubiquinone biosynthesis protein
MKSLLKLQSLAEDVPAQLQQILYDLESGKFRVNVTSPGLEQLATTLRIAAIAVFLGLVSGALLVGGFIALADSHWPGLPIAGGAAIAIAGLALAAASALLLLGGSFRKLSIRRLLGPRRK